MKRLRGNPGKRALPGPGEEPSPDLMIALGEPPAFLKDAGRAEWHRIGPQLISLGLLTEADMLMFVTYCMNVDMLIESWEDICANGYTVAGRLGSEVKNPAVSAFATATKALTTLCREFGMTPSSRARMRLPGDDDLSLADLLGTDQEEDAA